MSENTSIQLKKETKEKLAELGKKRDTYDDIIRQLLLCYDELKKLKGKKSL